MSGAEVFISQNMRRPRHVYLTNREDDFESEGADRQKVSYLHSPVMKDVDLERPGFFKENPNHSNTNYE